MFTRHSLWMVLNPEQHVLIAEAYERAAADYMVPIQHRKAFARKAEWFRMVARLGAKNNKMVEMPQLAGPRGTPMASLAQHLLAWQQRR
jgi:hypothetical protein